MGAIDTNGWLFGDEELPFVIENGELTTDVATMGITPTIFADPSYIGKLEAMYSEVFHA